MLASPDAAALEEENRRLREEIEEMRRLISAGCVAGVRACARDPHHPAFSCAPAPRRRREQS